jgi:hypothetical protein
MRFRDSGLRFQPKITIARLFRHERLLVLYVLPKEQQDNHDYLLDDILARLKAGNTQMAPGKGPALLVHIDDSMSHGDPKTTGKFNAAEMLRAFDRPDSLGLSPCEFWAFGMLKQKMMDRHL